MRFKEKETVVYFVRHGQTDFPTNRIYCDDREDPVLNKAGKLQAKSAAIFFENVEISAIYASPAARTLETAGQIADVTGREIEQSPALRERRFGAWEGMFFNEVEQKYPADYYAWKQDKIAYTPSGGETIEDLFSRVAGFVKKVVARHAGQKIAIVSHVGPLRVCVVDSVHIPLKLYRQIGVDYASITRIDYGETLNNLVFLNHSDHRK